MQEPTGPTNRVIMAGVAETKNLSKNKDED